MSLLKELSVFNKENLKYDLPSSIVVFLVALPLCLGIALASGVPLIAGLVTGIVGGIVVSMVSGSHLSVSGPAAGLTVIVAAAIAKIGSYEGFLLSVLMAGIIQLVLGFIKAGSIGKFFPSSVIKGMLAAIGIILILKQIPHAIGYDADYEGDFAFFQPDQENTFSEIFLAINRTNPGAIIISIISIIILMIWEKPFFRRYKLIPGPLVAVVSGILINKIYQWTGSTLEIQQEHLVNIPSFRSLSDIGAVLKSPDFSQLGNKQVYISGITLGIVATLETLLSIEAIDKLDPERFKTPNNRELKAQGIGNIVASLLGGLPLTAVIVRGSANINAGARSKASSFFHGCMLLLAVLLLSPVINQIPLSALAAILLMTGYKLTKISLFKDLYQQGWLNFAPFVVTIVAIIFTDLLIGIGIGSVVGAIFILYKNAGNSFYLSHKVTSLGNSYNLILAEEVTFLNKATISNTLENFPENSHVIIDAGRSKFIDHDVLEIIQDYRMKSSSKNIKVEILGLSKGNQKDVKLPEHEDHNYQQLFLNNRQWVQSKLQLDPLYFERIAEGQQPSFLLIGCSDSRVLPNEMTGTHPGEMFTHRNIANLVQDHDDNLMSVLQYSLEFLKVKHIIVCGHYGCGGVIGAIRQKLPNPIHQWLEPIRVTYSTYQEFLDNIPEEQQRLKKLVELNVTEQVNHLYNNSIVRKALSKGHIFEIHGWVYDIHEGTIKELQVDKNRILMDIH